jgi:uncharacterized protein (DUF58 family)
VGARRVTLTRRGWSLFGGALGLVVGKFLLGRVEMLALGIAALVLIAGVVLWLDLVSPPQLNVARRVRPDRLHVGSDGRIDILVENQGTRASPLLQVTDWFDERRRAARFLVPPLEPGGQARAAYRIPTRRRGRYVVGPLVLGAGDPFGLARRLVPGTGEIELIVRPRVHDIVAPVAAGSRMAADGETRGARAIASDLGHDFLTVREYELGDDLRRVHWRATARTGDLMIRHDEARWRSRAAVVLDVHASAHDLASFEVAVEATASVVARLVRQRRRVEVVASTGELLGTGGDARHDVIDRLATVGPDDNGRLELVCLNLRAHRRADLVIVVLGHVGRDAQRALAALSGLHVIAVLTQRATLTPRPSFVVVDASAAPFATAWNRALSTGTSARWQHVPAS